MANFLDKFKIKKAVDSSTKLDLGCDHITTANFMQYNIAYTKEMVPGEKISVAMETFTRLNPMPVPTFGRARINNRAFFVPFRTVFPGWNDFITDATHTFAGLGSGNTGEGLASKISKVPVIKNQEFQSLFLSAGNGMTVSGTAESHDIVTVSSAVTTDVAGYYKLTAKGRQAMKVLESLGYKVIWDIAAGAIEFSALPLLAMAKVYCDWYYPSAYVQDSTFAGVEALFKNDSVTTALNITSFDLVNIFNLIQYVNYDSDYFVSAWDNPNAPNNDAASSISLQDPSKWTVTGGAVVNVNYNTDDDAPFASAATTSGAPGRFTQWTIDALKSLTDYMKRHQLVGSRALDRYLSRFGVSLAAEKLNRSVYLGTGNDNITFGDIMSTSDTEGAALGAYAGKGIGYGTTSFEFDTDEYGILIIVSTIVPKTGYFQGINRNVMHVGRLDYWTPEFDNLGTQAIAKGEVYCPMANADYWNVIGSGTTTINGVFGYTPRYAEYKIGRDMLTGDFRYNSINTGVEAWHTMRELEYSSPANVVHNVDFVVGKDADQYSRIFYNTDADAADKFNVIYHFEIASYSPMKALFDTYEFDSKGDKVTVDANGVKMN